MTSSEPNSGPDQPAGQTTLVSEPEAPLATDLASAGSADLIADSFGEYTRIWFRRIRGGESGVLPVVVGLIVIVIYFQVRSSLFLSAGNLVNLMTQAAVIITLGMAEVFVLLLGDIDLSVGYNAANGAVIILWLLSLSSPVPLWVAVVAGLSFTSLYSGLQGYIVAKLHLPSFAVTLAGYLGAYGLLLYFIEVAAPGSGGTIRLNNSVLLDIEGGALSPVASWIVMAAAVAATAVFMIYRDARRRSSKLAAPPFSVTLLKIAMMAIIGVVIVLISNINRAVPGAAVVNGVPWVIILLLVLLVGYTTLLNRTRFGRYVYAMGGNAEAARRAGISLTRIRVTAFTLCGLTAGIAGLIYASNLQSMSNNFNGGQYVLYAVAAGVIGGTSLFGGRGRIVGAVLGGLVVGVIFNGLELLGLGAAPQNIWSAVVLLAAVLVDALARRGAAPR